MDASSVISSSNFTSILTTLQEQISVSTIVEVLAVAAGAAVGLAFMWWGVRKLVKVLMGAFRKGSVNV